MKTVVKGIFSVFLLLLLTLKTSGQNLEIALKNGDEKEMAAKAQMERILKKYEKDISKWLFTKKILIDKNENIPFSHPILTLNCNYLDDDLTQTSNFIHEQLHWFVETKPKDEENAIKEFKKLFPQVPVRGREGAQDEYSTYLHLIVCDLEFQALTKLVGEKSAKELLLKFPYYKWIYKTVIENKKVREINSQYGFIVP